MSEGMTIEQANRRVMIQTALGALFLIGGGGAAILFSGATIADYADGGSYTIYYGPVLTGLAFGVSGIIKLASASKMRAEIKQVKSQHAQEVADWEARQAAAEQAQAAEQAEAHRRAQQEAEVEAARRAEAQSAAAAQQARAAEPDPEADAEYTTPRQKAVPDAPAEEQQPDPAQDRTRILAEIAVRAMATVAAADDALHEHEIAVIRAVTLDVMGSTITEESVRGFFANMMVDKSQSEGDLNANLANMTEDERQRVFLCAATVAYADGQLAEKEKTMLSRFAGALQLSLDTQDSLMKDAFHRMQTLAVEGRLN